MSAAQRSVTRPGAATFLAVALLAACSDFLAGPGLSTDPNFPTAATPSELFIGAEMALRDQWENYRNLETWVGELVGVGRGGATLTTYSSQRGANGTADLWFAIYGPGGLRDLRAVEQSAISPIDSNYKLRGEARVLEALYLGTAADVFGSVPYSAALTPNAHFDSQSVVYAHVQEVLDSALDDLSRTGTGSVDYFYDNKSVRWIAAAHTLKARYLMHTARSDAVTYDLTLLALVAAEAALGIGDTAGDLQVVHASGNAFNVNLNYYPLITSANFQPSEVHVSLVREAQEESLLPRFYVPNHYGEYVGTLPDLSPPTDSVSAFALTQLTPTGIATFSENQMLLAEAQFRLNSLAAAKNVLDDYRTTVGAGPLGPLTATELLEAILREKYIHSFLNLESWNDYLRTCYPNLALPQGAQLPYVPASLPVPYTEQYTNPNVPLQPTDNPGNANDPKNRLAIDGTPCLGQQDREH